MNKPTLKKPVSDQSKNFEASTKKVNSKYGVSENRTNPYLNEINVLLNEKEMSLKKKIFSLPKMEALVHNHPRLSEIYREMAADGEERYGYHYNETIMNIIFNDYVLNDSELLQLYYKAKPKEKKRRDKFGIKKLQDDGEKNKNDKDGAEKKKDDKVNENLENETIEPEEDDCYVQSNGFKLSVSCGGKFIGEYVEDEEAWEAVRKWKELNKFYPNTWFVSDHGNLTLVDDSGNDINETTTGSVGGGVFGSGGYATPHAWSSQGDIMGNGKKGKILRRALRESNNNYLINGTAFEDYYNELNESFDSNINELINEFMGKYIRERSNTNEEAKSKSQQKFMGMVRGVQKGEINPSEVSKDVRKAAKEMKKGDVKDFASTSHEDLPEKVNEHHLHTPEEQAEFVADFYREKSGNDVFTADYFLRRMPPKDIKSMYDAIEREMGLVENNLNEHHIDENDPYKLAEFIVTGYHYLNPDKNITNQRMKQIINDFSNKSLKFLKSAYNTIENNLGEDGIAEVDNIINGINETENSIISGSDQSMTFKPQPEGDLGSIPMGMQDSGGLREEENDDNKIDWEKVKNNNTKPTPKDKFITFDDVEMFEENYPNDDPSNKLKPKNVDADIGKNIKSPNKEKWGKTLKDKFITFNDVEMFEELNEELEAISIIHNKLKNMTEDRRPSALVLKDRLGKDNQKNFKNDMKDSGTKDVLKMQNDMAWKEQQEDVSKNPYKNGEKIEKESLKKTNGEALNNVGNSTNKKGDEVPKRNLTDDEQNVVDMYRLGQQDLVYDNKPDDRFEDRMIDDLGDELYDQRQKKMEFRGKAPMYNKETQPIDDTKSKKMQFNKEQTGWNKKTGLEESDASLTGKYLDVLGKKRYIDFKLNEVKVLKNQKMNKNCVKVDFMGLGNFYDNRGNINESVKSITETFKFYTDGSNVVAIKLNKNNLNENKTHTISGKKPVNEEFNKMKHLLGYNPKTYIDTKKNKL